ncbi:MAG: serine hydrolase [bacterium]
MINKMKKMTFFLLLFVLLPINIYALDVESSNYIMVNLDTDKIILEEKSNERISIASLTKIVTAITVLDNIDNIDTKVTITSDDLEGLAALGASVAGFWVGQTLTIEDLLYGLMLPSGADAANALVNYFETIDLDLIELMNKTATDLGLVNSNFVNAHGLDEENHYSTMYDIYNILSHAIDNEIFYEIFTTSVYLTSDTKVTLRSTHGNAMANNGIENNYIIGAKTGYTSNAGLCLGSISYFDETNFMLITCGASKSNSANHLLDSIDIYSLVDNKYKELALFDKDDFISYIPAEYAKVLQYNIKALDDYYIYAENTSDYKYEFIGVESINPSTPLESIGVINIYYKNYLLDTIDVEYDGTLEYSFEGYIATHTELILTVCGSVIMFLVCLSVVCKIVKKG